MNDISEIQARIIPLPKQISVQGAFGADVGAIKLVNYFHDHGMAHAAMSMLKELVGNNGEGEFEIQLRPAGTLPAGEVRQSLSEAVSPDQAYWIQSDQSGIVIAANAEDGVLNGVKTLRQILDIKDERFVEIPAVTILDWPDVPIRGQWGGDVIDDMEWMSRWKLNEVDYMPKVGLDADKQIRMLPESAERFRQAEKLGIHITAYIPHLEQLTQILPELFSEDDLKEMANVPSEETAKRCDYRPGLCMSSEGVVSFLRDWMKALAREKSVRNIQVWLSEDAAPCYCPQCQGREPFAMETACILRAFEAVKQQYPHITLEILLTQGSYPVNEQICAMVPKDVSVTYYDGGRTYSSDREPMIYEGLMPFLREGGRLGVYPQITHAWRTVFPWSGPDFIRYRCQEFAQKGLSKVVGYAVPANFYHRMNILAMAEWLWNSRGRDEESFIRAYARLNRMDPDALVQWSGLEMEPAWKLAASRFLLNMIYRYSVVLKKPLGFMDHRFALSDIQPIDRVEELIQSAVKAAEVAKTAGLAAEEVQSRCLAQALSCYQRFCGCIREPSEERYRGFAGEADALYWSLMKWDAMVRPSYAEAPSRLMDTATVLFRAADYVYGQVVERQGAVEDVFGYHPLGEWDEHAFTAEEITLTYDVTRCVQGAGTYLASFDFVDSRTGTHIRRLSLTEETKSGKRILAEAESKRILNVWEPWCEIAVEAAGLEPDGRRYLSITLGASTEEEGMTCRGMVGIRKV